MELRNETVIMMAQTHMALSFFENPVVKLYHEKLKKKFKWSDATMQSLTPSARTVKRVLEDLSESSKLLIRDHGETLAAEGRLSLTMDHYYSKNGSMEFEYWYNGVLLHLRTDSGQLLSYLLRYKVTSDKTNHGVVSELQETLEDYHL